MTRLVLTALPALALLALAGCDDTPADGPPSIRIGDAVCDECNMIISDARFATATVVEGPRGPEARVFDDFNCQVNYEIAHKDLEILRRWSHDYTASEWLPTEQAVFVMSPNLRTPMASRTVAFATKSEAEAAQKSVGGDVITFDIAWRRLGLNGPCCPSHAENTNGASDEAAHH